MIEFVRQTPAWIIDNPWTSAAGLVVGLTLFTSLILFNAEGRQIRNLWRKK